MSELTTTDVEVLAAFSILEAAEDPVPEHRFRALRDPALRSSLGELCAQAGRLLMSVGDGWITGYDDKVADRLASEGVGVLSERDRAVLCLVLLHAAIIPRAQGRIESDDWADADGTTVEAIALNRHLSKAAIQASVRRLAIHGIVARTSRGGIVPGPQLRRTTRDRNERIWAHLTLAARPHGMLAAALRKRLARDSAVPGEE